MSIWASIFGSSENTGKIIDGATSGLDKIVFTKEERADANQKLSDWYLKYLQSTQPQNLARRLIAMVIVWTWWLLVVFGVICRGIELWIFDTVPEGVEYVYSEYVFKVLTDVVMRPFSIVISFYFLTHVVRTYQNGKADK